MSLRLASAVTMAFYGLAAVVILRRGGFQIGWLSRAVARVGTWVLVVILPLSALAIFLSQSSWEKFLMAPTALVLAVLCLIVARRTHAGVGSASGEHERSESPGIRSSV